MTNKYSVIAAVDEAWGLGKGGLIPWHYPEDFAWFKKATQGATCFMGRKTYEEITKIMKGKKELLPGRKCVVISSNAVEDSRVTWLRSISDYHTVATEDNYFIGGASIYAFGLNVASRVFITGIPGDHNCDVFFPYKDLMTKYHTGNTITLSSELRVYEYLKNESV